MQQKQRRVKTNPAGANQNEDDADALPTPPPIDDLVKAAEMAAEEQRAAVAAAELATKEAALYAPSPNEAWEDADYQAARKAISRETAAGKRQKNKRKLQADPDYVCICLESHCRIGPFIMRYSKWKAQQ